MSQSQNSDLKTSNGKDCLRILHVDDDAGFLEVSKSVLELEGNFEVDTASSVDEAFKKLEAQSFDAVISDYEMPQKDGLAFLREVREQKNAIPFMLFTGKGREDVAIRALNLGADGYFHKQGKPETVYGELAHGIRLVAEKWKVKEALRESENRYRSLMEQAADAILVHDQKGKIVDANKQACKLLGYTTNELLSMSISDISPTATENEVATLWPKIIAGQTFTLECYHKHKNGNTIPVEVTMGPVTVDKEIQIIGLVRDITERHRMEGNLRASEEKYRGLFESTQDGIVVSDAHGVVASTNQAATTMFGYKNGEELVNVPAVTLWADSGDRQVLFELLAKKGTVRDYEVKLKRKDGAIFDARVTVTLQKDLQDKVLRSETIIRDISDRKRNEVALLQSETQFGQLFSSMPSGVSVYEAVDNGEDFVFRDYNAAAEKIDKISRDIVVGKRVTQVFAGVKSFGLFEVFQRVWRTGQPEYFPAAMYKDDRDPGSWRENWVYKLTNGNIVAIFNDITDRKNIEQQFADEHALVESTTNSAGALIFSIDRNYRYTSFNHAHASVMKAIYGVDIQIGKSILDYMCVAVDREEAKQNLDKALAGEQLSEEAYSGDDKLSRKYFIVSHSPIRNAKGEITGVVVVSNDISERKAAEEELKMAATIFDLATDAICVLDTKGNMVNFNEAAYKLYGYSKDEMAKMNLTDLDTPETAALIESRMKLLFEAGSAVFEGVHVRKDKTLIHVEVHARIIDLEGKKLILSVARDISERKKAEDALQRSEVRFRQLSENIEEWIWEADSNGLYTFSTSVVEKLLGYTPDEIVGKKHFYDLFLVDEQEELKKAALQAFASKRSFTGFLNRNVHKNGNIVWLSTSGVPILDEKGDLLGYRGLDTDISERRKAEEVLRASEEKHRKLFEGALDAIFLADAETGIIIDCNPAALEMVGREKAEIVGIHQRILHPQNEIEGDAARTFKQHIRQDGVLEAQVITKKGEIKEVSIKSNRVLVGGREVLQGVFRDVTERKKTEEDLRISQRRLKKAQVVAHIGDWDWNIQTDVLIWGDENYKIFGFPREIVPSVEKFLGAVHPDDAAFVKQSIEDALKGKPYDIDMRIIRTDGVERLTNATGEVEFDAEGKPVRMFGMVQDITERKKVEEELKMAAHIFDLATDSIFVHDIEGNIIDFNEVAYKLRGYSKEEMAKMNIRDLDVPESAVLIEPRVKGLFESGSAVFESVHVCKDKTLLPVEIHARIVDLEGKKLVLAVARDISERRKAEEELNRMMDQLVLVNEKLGVVGSLTRHDVRNKLSVVTGHAYLLKKKYAGQADIVERLSKMEQAVADSVRIFEFSKMYEQLGVGELTYVDVEKAVDEAAALFSGLTIKVVNGCHGLAVLADSFLRQLFYNFIDNTRKYGKKTTLIQVYFEKSDSGDLHLIYEDDGVGISAENKLKLFSEGFSTGGSTGFGLFLIRKMVNVYGWQIEETGEPGKGANFVITVPKVNQGGKEYYQITS